MLPRELPLDHGRGRSADTAAPPPSANGTAAPLWRPEPLPPALAKPFSPRNLARALRRQWVLALSAGLAAGVVAGCAVWALLPASRYSPYTARASLQVNAAAADLAAGRGTLPARVKSRAVLDDVLAKPEINGLSLLTDTPDAAEFLRKELAVAWGPDSDVLTIQMSGDRPRELAALVNAVADAAVLDINGSEQRARESQLAQLEKLAGRYEAALRPERKRLEELAQAAGTEPAERVVRQVLVALALGARQAELLKVQGERRDAEALLKGGAGPRPSEVAPASADSKDAFEEALRKDPEMRPLVAQIADLNSQIVRYAALYKDNPARGKQVIEEKGLQSQIDSLYALGRRQYEKKLRALGGVADSPRPAANGADEVRARISSSEATEAALQKEVDRLEGELRGLASRSAEIEALKQDLQAREDLSRGVAAALEKARLELSAPPRASRLDEAAVPVLRQERRLTFAGPAGLGGFALALFGVAVLECRRRKVHTGADLAQGLGLPVAGVLPLLPPSLNPLDPAHTTPRRGVPWHGLPNDSVDGIRALLTQAAPPRAVAVVGAAGGEGASVLAVQLAAGLARAGRRTLLLDANLRRPALHRAFGLVAKPGLADVLRGEAALPAVVRAAPADRLWVLPAGAADLRALLALSRDGVQTVLDQLKKDYDHVVIDATPVAACADALPLAQRTDAVLVSALAGVSELPAVYDAWQRLSALGARLLGVVVQGAADGAAARRPYAMPPSAS